VVEGEVVNFFEFLPILPQLPEAKCRDIENPDIFFPESRAEERTSLPTIRALCESCTERKECLDYALDNEISSGIWAGFTTEQRKRMLNARYANAPKANNAEKVRVMFKSGCTPKEIAVALKVEHSYVTTVLKRAGVKLEGDIQSQLTIERLSRESQSSSGFQQ
jgi:WhiB family redox-sensing transcriptional regulator